MLVDLKNFAKIKTLELFLIILALTAFFNSCKKDTIDIDNFLQCTKTQNLDSALVANKLSGSWIWKKQSCDYDKKVKRADKTVKVTFNSNGTFNVVETANIVAQGTWKLKILDSALYGLDLSQPSQYLYGKILFCSNDLLFNGSSNDLCDNLFSKSN